MKFHVNPKTGEPGKCSAEKDNCPFGGDANHFTSPEAARFAYEASQKTFSMPLKEMNSLSKTTDNPEEIAQFIENGSERTWANLAKNPALSSMAASLILDKTKNPVVRAVIYGRKDLAPPLGGLTPDDLEELAFRRLIQDSSRMLTWSHDVMGKIAEAPHFTDEHYDRVMNSSRIPAHALRYFPVVLGLKNNISPEKTLTHMRITNWRSHPLDGELALVNGKISEEDLYEAPQHYFDSHSAVSVGHKLTTREVDMLLRVALKRGDERLIQKISEDSRVSEKSLDSLVANGHHTKEIYLNPKTSEDSRRKIQEALPEEPFVRMDILRKRIGDEEFDSLMSKGGGSILGRSYSESVTNFDLNKVKEYGITREDIMYLVGANGYNAGISYDETTGRFAGRIDSSG